MDKTGMKVLVTGSSGFIGTHTVNGLYRTGHEVRAFDITGGQDIRDSTLVDDKVRGVDAVIHLAALIDIPYSFEHPEKVADVNITGTVNVLKACKNHGVKCVFASSAAVYGEPQKLPVAEDHPLNPTNPYGISKVAGEMYANHYGAVILRYFNVYGPGQKAGILAQKNPIIYGDGKQTRDFIHVSDVARANVLALTAPAGTYNIGTGVETSILDVVKNPSGFMPAREGDIRRIYADTSKAERVMGFKAIVPMNNKLVIETDPRESGVRG